MVKSKKTVYTTREYMRMLQPNRASKQTKKASPYNAVLWKREKKKTLIN